MRTDEHISGKPDAYQLVNQFFTEQLVKGVMPWHYPYTEIPKDITGYPVSGINAFLLGNLGYPRNIFFTSEQITALGYTPKHGAKGHLYVNWKKEQKKKNRMRGCFGQVFSFWEPNETQLHLQHQKVFNIEQLKNVKKKKLPPTERRNYSKKECDKYFKKMKHPPTIASKGTSVFYSRAEDAIYVPAPEYFENDEQRFSALFYALVQSTGHPKRCNRPSCIDRNISDAKVFDLETLIWEMGCCFLCTITGIEPWYIRRYHTNCESWLRAFEQDTTLVVTACEYASQSVGYLLV